MIEHKYVYMCLNPCYYMYLHTGGYTGGGSWKYFFTPPSFVCVDNNFSPADTVDETLCDSFGGNAMVTCSDPGMCDIWCIYTHVVQNLLCVL